MKNKQGSGSKSAPSVAVAAISTPGPVVGSGVSIPIPVVGIGATGSAGGIAIPGLGGTGLTNSGKVESPYSNGFEAKVVKCLAGLQKFMPAGSSLIINGQSMSQETLVSAFQAVLNLYTALTTALQQSKATVSQARLALSAQLPAARQLFTGLDHALIAFFGKGNPVLTNFGIASGARKPSTSATEAAAAATAKLTRQARHTMGKKQRLLVTGGKATVVAVGPSGDVVPGGSPGAALPAASATPTVVPSNTSSTSSGTGNGGGGTPSAS